ncbi:MAG: hypothetical protein H2042_19495 [Rhizobiales bacterium]|nr:hypothetical protein [Hyphomicrobiales bacterium]
METILKPISASILAFLREIDTMSVPPLGRGSATGEDAQTTAQFIIVLLIFVLARSILAGGGFSLSAGATMAGVAAAILLLAGMLVRFLYYFPPIERRRRTLRLTSFLLIFLIFSMLLFVVIDFISHNFLGYPLSIAAVQIGSGFLDLDPGEWTGPLRALIFSVLAWVLLAVKTHRQRSGATWGSMFLTHQFPLFVLTNSVLLYVLVMMAD